MSATLEIHDPTTAVVTVKLNGTTTTHNIVSDEPGTGHLMGKANRLIESFGVYVQCWEHARTEEFKDAKFFFTSTAKSPSLFD